MQSRYYDPALGRFLNADSYASTGQGFLGYNMFAYCGNNPVCQIDYHGHAKADALHPYATSLGAVGFVMIAGGAVASEGTWWVLETIGAICETAATCLDDCIQKIKEKVETIAESEEPTYNQNVYVMKYNGGKTKEKSGTLVERTIQSEGEKNTNGIKQRPALGNLSLLQPAYQKMVQSH